MKEGVLEVLLVNAKGLRRTNFIGRPAYYAAVECGGRVYKSKVSLGKDRRAWWNQKFKFEFPLSNWRNSSRHLKIRIMDLKFLGDSGSVGETIIFLGGVISEGLDRRGSIEVKPTPFNVVLEDDTYKGQIVIGFKFTVREEIKMEMTEYGAEEEKSRSFSSMLWCIMGIWKISNWWKIFSGMSVPSSLESSKDTMG